MRVWKGFPLVLLLGLLLFPMTVKAAGPPDRPLVATVTPPPTLKGEGIRGDTTAIPPIPCGNGTLTYSYSVSGIATGPYAGPSTEHISYTVTNGQVTELTTTFTITAPNGTVSGSKRITSPNGSATCDVFLGKVRVDPATYEIEIGK